MAISSKPQQVGLSDPRLVRQTESQLAQDAIIARGKPAVVGGQVVLPSTTVRATPSSVTTTTSATNQTADTTTVYQTNGTVYVSSIDQTVQNVVNKNIVNQIGVTEINAGNNITITSSDGNGSGIVTINAVIPAIGNIAVINLDGNAYNVLHGDGTWSADTTTYGNSNVVTLLSAFGSNSIYTTGNITANVFGGNAIQGTANITVTANANSWTFGQNGNLTLPGNTFAVNYANGTQVPIGTGGNPFNQDLNTNNNVTFNQVDISEGAGTLYYNSDVYLENNNNGENIFIRTNAVGQVNDWIFGNAGDLTLPTTSLGTDLAEQAVIKSQRKIIPPGHYSAIISSASPDPTVVYTATSTEITSMKIAFQIQHAGLGVEMFDVSATYTGVDAYYAVSSGLGPPTITTSTVLVNLNGSGVMQITLTINSGANPAWVTYDATEFGIPNL